MGDSGDVWRSAKAERRRVREVTTSRRFKRFQRLAQHPEIIVVRELGSSGYRLIYYDDPVSRYVDFWPSTSTFRDYRGRKGKGWVRLLKRLGIERGPWEREARP